MNTDRRPPRLPLGRAHLLASTVVREARRAGLPTESLVSVGSLRRYAPDVGDVSLLAVAAPRYREDVLTGFSSLPSATGTSALTPTSVTISTERGPVTLHVAPPDQRGAALLWHTGSRAHNVRLVARASRFGLHLDSAELTRAGGRTVDASSEHLVYRHLDLPYIAPELREGGNEIDAAERGTLPPVIAEIHIRGDLHMHSTWSDGRDDVATMVMTSQQLGYEYIAITDHSQRAFSSRKLSIDDVARQRDEIAELREQASGITILHGVEVDIMTDGSLDFDDELLAGFDIVLASLHDPGGQSGEELTARYLQAIAHPLVNVITHPANRSPGLSPGYQVDFDALFSAAVESGTALEIDGSPSHLDMDGVIARRAAAAGVTITINSDCHRAEALHRQMRFGVGTARRGWIEPHQVLNTRRIEQVRTFVAAKRARS